jgi:hypothetical protein
MMMMGSSEKTYPGLTEYVYKYLPKVASQRAIVAAMNRHGHLKPHDFWKALKPKSGLPILQVADGWPESVSGARFKDNTIYVDSADVVDFPKKPASLVDFSRAVGKSGTVKPTGRSAYRVGVNILVRMACWGAYWAGKLKSFSDVETLKEGFLRTAYGHTYTKSTPVPLIDPDPPWPGMTREQTHYLKGQIELVKAKKGNVKELSVTIGYAGTLHIEDFCDALGELPTSGQYTWGNPYEDDFDRWMWRIRVGKGTWKVITDTAEDHYMGKKLSGPGIGLYDASGTQVGFCLGLYPGGTSRIEGQTGYGYLLEHNFYPEHDPNPWKAYVYEVRVPPKVQPVLMD